MHRDAASVICAGRKGCEGLRPSLYCVSLLAALFVFGASLLGYGCCCFFFFARINRRLLASLAGSWDIRWNFAGEHAKIRKNVSYKCSSLVFSGDFGIMKQFYPEHAHSEIEYFWGVFWIFGLILMAREIPFSKWKIVHFKKIVATHSCFWVCQVLEFFEEILAIEWN